MSRGWIGVDLDGTLAEYHGWMGAEHIGKPIRKMVRRVRTWLKAGRDVRIFTARVGPTFDPDSIGHNAHVIRRWCVEHVGKELATTDTIDTRMTELWSARCVQVVKNAGERAVSVGRKGKKA